MLILCFLIFCCKSSTNGAWGVQFIGDDSCKDTDVQFAMKFTDECIFDGGSGMSFLYKCSKEPSYNVSTQIFNNSNCGGEAVAEEKIGKSYDCEKNPGLSNGYSELLCLDDYQPSFSNLHFLLPFHSNRKDVGSPSNPVIMEYFYPLLKCYQPIAGQNMFITSTCDEISHQGDIKIYESSQCQDPASHEIKASPGEVVDMSALDGPGQSQRGKVANEEMYWKFVSC